MGLSNQILIQSKSFWNSNKCKMHSSTQRTKTNKGLELNRETRIENYNRKYFNRNKKVAINCYVSFSVTIHRSPFAGSRSLWFEVVIPFNIAAPLHLEYIFGLFPNRLSNATYMWKVMEWLIFMVWALSILHLSFSQ